MYRDWAAQVRFASADEADSYPVSDETREFFNSLDIREAARLLAYRRAVRAGLFNDYRLTEIAPEAQN